MTAPLTFVDIERLLRQPAPDEPAILPALVLPTDAGSVRGRVAVGARGRQLPVIRPAYAAVALLLLLAAVIAAGALRVFDRPDTFAEGCLYDPAQPVDPACLSVVVPEGWTVLGSGQLFPGNFTEPGIGYEYVELVMASAPLGGCASPGGPPPTAIPAGTNGFEVPAPTPDAGLACLRTAVLPPNAVRVVTMKGSRITGLAPGGYGIPDTSEPTAEAGWTEAVAGRPARLTVTSGGTASRPTETRVWDILWPGSIDHVLRIRADIAGPDLERGRAAVADVIDSVRFPGTDVPPLEESQADEVLQRLLDDLDREARRTSHSDYYACFPREPGSAAGTITGGPYSPLASPLGVTCSSAISPSRARVWRVALEVSWPTAGGVAGDTLRTEYFTTGVLEGQQLSLRGGYMTSLTGRPMPDPGPESWFPNSAFELPPPLDGPLKLSPGSFAEMLWPGDATAQEPGSPPLTGGSDAYPRVVGLHLYILEGPRLEGGQEWYRVQWETGGYPETGWLRGTRDGRPLLRPIDPECPSGDPTVGDVTWLIAPERVACFGSRELAFGEAQLVPLDPAAIVYCDAAEGEIEPCPPGEPAWLTGQSTWLLWGPRGPTGPEPALEVWLDPSVELPPEGVRGRVRGHFDDPEARGCELPSSSYPTLGPGAPAALQELLCRQRFVVTSVGG